MPSVMPFHKHFKVNNEFVFHTFLFCFLITKYNSSWSCKFSNVFLGKMELFNWFCGAKNNGLYLFCGKNIFFLEIVQQIMQSCL